MRGSLLVIIICSLIAGIIISELPGIGVWYALFPILPAFALFILQAIYRKNHPFSSARYANEIISSCLFVSLGIFSGSLHKTWPTKFIKGDYFIEGKVIDYTPTNYGDKTLIEVSRISPAQKNHQNIVFSPKNLKVLATINSSTPISYNSIVAGKATLAPPESPGNFLNIDYTRYLKQKGIYLTGYMEEAKTVVTPPKLGFSFKLWRDELESAIENLPLATDTRNFLISLLLGDKTYIDKEDRDLFANTGISHIFAVSGLHVSMVSVGILAIMSLLFLGKLRRWKYVAAIPVIWFYIILVGASPATCRAGIMLTLAFWALFLQRKHNPVVALGWAIVLILAFSPNALYDIGFQLSVVCVGSLVLIAAPLNFINHRQNPRLFKLVSIILVTLTATFSSWIICAFYFHKFSLMFLPLNLIVVPILPFYILGALIYIFVYYIIGDFPILKDSLDVLLLGFKDLASKLTSFSSPVENLFPSAISVFLWLGGIIVLAVFLRRKVSLKTLWLPAGFFFASIFTLIYFPKALPQGFIIQKNSSAATIMSYDKGKESLIAVPETSSSIIRIHGKTLLALNSAHISDETLGQAADADMILLCKGCNVLPEELVSSMKEGCLFVTHPSIHWRYERKILAEAREYNINCHSLRYQGALHIFN